MLPLLNGKSFLDCTEADLSFLIDNSDFRENQYIDYKTTFSILEKSGADREHAISEFRSDICSFANAEGGYLIYGIKEKQGVAREIVGVDILNGNTDRFELDRRNNLSAINPKVPSVKFGFIPLSNGKYVVIIEIKPDYYSPYIHIENEQNYRIYTRGGNGKTTMKYDELRRMFNSSMTFEYELKKFREERIAYYKSMSEDADDEYSKFVLVHLVPRTFTDPATYRQVYMDYLTQGTQYSNLASGTTVSGTIIPNVDGITFTNSYSKSECRFYNNGVFETFISKVKFVGKLKSGKIFFAYEAVWEEINKLLYNYNCMFCEDASLSKYYICISIIGCKGLVTEEDYFRDASVAIDRNTVMCSPVEVNLTSKNFVSHNSVLQAQLNYLLSLGIRDSKKISNIISSINERQNNS